MKVILSDMVGIASGRSGSVVFSRNRYGPYVRSHAIPVNVNSARQTAVRTRMQYLSDLWRTGLTEAQRVAWELYASSVLVKDRFGSGIFITGMNHFLRSNSVRMQVGLDIVLDGPTIFALPEADPTFAISASEATQIVSATFDNTLAFANEEGGFLSVFIGQPKNETINFFNGPWRFGDSADGDAVTPPTSPLAVTSPWAVTSGQKVWAYARIGRSDGRLSETFRYEIVVGA